MSFALEPPIFGETAGAGGGEDGLAEGFEDLWDFFEAGSHFVDFCEERLDFGYDAFLFRSRSNWDLQRSQFGGVAVRLSVAGNIVCYEFSILGRV